MNQAASKEIALRAITNDGAFRVITLCATDTVRKILSTQKARGRAAYWLGELITGTILVRETMAPSYRVQGVITDSEGRAHLVADSHPDGGTRGLLRLPAGESDLNVNHVIHLGMMRTLLNGEVNQGVVEVPEAGNLSKALMTYMTVSEQVASVIAVGCVIEKQGVAAAGGYMVQLLPEVGREPLEAMTERLSRIDEINRLLMQAGGDPAQIMKELSSEMRYTELERKPLFFKCRCSPVSVLASLATIGKDEIRKMVKEAKVIDLLCEYCGAEYRVMPDQLKGLLARS